jgi:drug/metabolite transporter (DMT)-like permease
MHISSGRWVYGFFLTLLTALLWGILPIKLKQVLQVMDPITVTWFRLMVSGGCLFLYLAATRRLPSLKCSVPGAAGWWDGGVRPGGQLRVVPGGPEAAQPRHRVGGADGADLVADRQRVRVQGALQPRAGLGLVVLMAGFGLFFNQRLAELLTSLGAYTAGVLTVLLATSIWVFYALGQKQLLTVWNSLQVMMVIYLSAPCC